MAHLSTLNDYRFSGDVDDIRGSHLYGRGDRKLGTIEDVIFDHSSGLLQYVVVDTGGWLSSHRFVIPADRMFARREHENDFAVDLTREEIESFPEYNENLLQQHGAWHDYENSYMDHWASGPVLHGEGSDHVIASARAEDTAIPGNALQDEEAVWETEEVENTPSGPFTPADATAPARNSAREMITAEGTVPASAYGLDSRIVPGGQSEELPPAYREQSEESVYSSQPEPAERHSRLRDFEELLRRNRIDITASCRSCAAEREKAA